MRCRGLVWAGLAALGLSAGSVAWAESLAGDDDRFVARARSGPVSAPGKGGVRLEAGTVTASVRRIFPSIPGGGVVVTFDNEGARPAGGVLWVQGFAGRHTLTGPQGEEGYLVPFEIPAGARRVQAIQLPPDVDGDPLEAQLRVRGAAPGELARLLPEYHEPGTLVGLIAPESTLFSALTAQTAQAEATFRRRLELTGGYDEYDLDDAVEAHTEAELIEPVAIPLDPISLSPEMPHGPLAWRPFDLVALDGALLPKLHPQIYQGLRDWVFLGGHLMIFAGEEDLRREARLTELVGALWAGRAGRGRQVVPTDAGEAALAGDRPGLFSEPWGARLPVGFGEVMVVGYDGATRFAEAPETYALLVQAAKVAESRASPIVDSVNNQSWTRSFLNRGLDWSPEPPKKALDPNLSLKIALPWVALVLLLYVIALGPLSIRAARRRGRPTWLLFSTPALAALACLAILGVGWVSKGRARHLSAEHIIFFSGDEEAHSLRLRGLFPTAPTEISHRPRPGVSLLAPIWGRPGTHLYTGAGWALEGYDVGFWETVFVREDELVPAPKLRLHRGAEGSGASSYRLVGAELEGARGAALLGEEALQVLREGGRRAQGEAADPDEEAWQDLHLAGEVSLSWPGDVTRTLGASFGMSEGERSLFVQMLSQLSDDETRPAAVVLLPTPDDAIGPFAAGPGLKVAWVFDRAAPRPLGSLFSELQRKRGDLK